MGIFYRQRQLARREFFADVIEYNRLGNNGFNNKQEVYQMTTVSLEQFKDLSREEQITIHEEMKKNMGVDGILKHWNLSRSKYYYMLRKLKLNTDNPEQNESKTKSKPSGSRKGTRDYKAPLDLEQPPAPMFNSSEDKMLVSVSIQESPQVVNAILKSVEELLHTSNSNYSFNLTIREL